MVIKRDSYLKKLLELRGNNMAKVITGIRRCGKSFLLKNIFTNYLLENEGVAADHIIYVALDTPGSKQLCNADALYNYITSKTLDNAKYYILLDEIQLVPNFEFLVNGLVYNNNYEVYITGSNSKFLSSDIATEFRGRGWEVRVQPLSFSEVCSIDGLDKDYTGIWQDYIKYGGLPAVWLMSNNSLEKMEYLQMQATNVYLNDIVSRYNVQNRTVLNSLTSVMASNIGCLTNPTKLVNTFKSKVNESVAWNTIDSYLNYMEDAFLVERVERYDVKGRKYIGSPAKYYFTDIGVRNSLVNYRQIEETHIMENVIYNELRRRGYRVDVGVVNDRITKNGESHRSQLEIDFIAEKGSDRVYIQSAYMMYDQDKVEQEKRPLKKVEDNFRKVVICMNANGRGHSYDDTGIMTMGLFDFLTDDKSLEY